MSADPSTADRAGLAPQRAFCVRADNAGAMTLDGTNTWLLREPGADRCVVVDPGPDDADHLAAVLAECARLSVVPALAVLTHGHPDHAGNVDSFVAATGAPVRALDPAWCRGTVPLVDGDELDVDGLRLRVMATPGHTADSLSLVVATDGSVLTGDTVLGRGTTVVAYPDGSLANYLASVQRIRAVAAAGNAIHLLPGHGPEVVDALRVVDALLAHRQDRLDQVTAALDTGADDVTQVAAAVYGMPGPGLHAAVLAQVRAQLVYLSSRGVLRAGRALERS